jgi:hypothetical protein
MVELQTVPLSLEAGHRDVFLDEEAETRIRNTEIEGLRSYRGERQVRLRRREVALALGP